jgi:hypothetical protein
MKTEQTANQLSVKHVIIALAIFIPALIIAAIATGTVN